MSASPFAADAATHPGAATCPSCGDRANGRFCSSCGERRMEPGEHALRHFLADAFHHLTSLDSRALRTFAALLARPGLLTREFMAGRRRPYLGPLQLFLICNVVFFVAQPFTGADVFTTPLRYHLNMPHGGVARTMVEDEVRQRGVSEEEYRRLFDAAVETQARTLVIVMVPVFAALLALLHWRLHRYFVEHLVFAFHTYAFVLLFSTTVTPLVRLLYRAVQWTGADAVALLGTGDAVASTLVLGVVWLYLWLALRRTYCQGALASAAKGLGLALGMFVVLQLYRSLLFFTTFHSL